MSVQEIKAAISQLSPNDLAELQAWLNDYLTQPLNEWKREQKLRAVTAEVFERRQSAYQRLAEGAG